MDLSGFFNSWIGLYITQAFFHSILSCLIVELAIYIWKIHEPHIKQAFYFIVIIFPIFSMPFYQLLNPERNTVSFRLEAYFDSQRWLNLMILGKIPLGLIFILFLVFTSLLFILQELIPIIRHLLESEEKEYEIEKVEEGSPILKVLDTIPVEKPDIYIIDDEDYILYSTTVSKPAIYISKGLVEEMDQEQLKAAIAHEVAHIIRNKKPLLIAVFLLRILMFFNPVVLIQFRRAVEEEEKICDDMAVSWTGTPVVLAETLGGFFSNKGQTGPNQSKGSLKTLEDYSHDMVIETRVKRLARRDQENTNWVWVKFLLTLFSILYINYKVV